MLLSVVIAVVVIVLLSGAPLTGHDNPGLSGPSNQIGVAYRDLGDAHLKPGAKPPRYDSDPPTSGPHVGVAITHDERTISDDQLLQALEAGNVIVMYGTRQAAAGSAPPRRVARSSIHPRPGRGRAGGDPGSATRDPRPGGAGVDAFAARSQRRGPPAAQLHPLLARSRGAAVP